MNRRLLDSYLRFCLHFEPSIKGVRKAHPERQTVILVSMAIVLSSVLFLYATITLIKTGWSRMTIAEYVAAFATLLCPYVLKFSGQPILAGNYFMFCGVTSISMLSLFTGGFQSPIIFWGPLVSFCSGIVVSRKHVWFWVVSYALVVVGFIIFRQQIALQSHGLVDSDFISHIRTRVIFASIFMSGILTYIYVNAMDRYVAKIKESEDDLHTLLKLVSHDVSTPLSVISMASHALKRSESLDPKIGKVRERILKATNQVSEILNKVRELESLHTGKLAVKLVRVCLHECVEQAVELQRGRADLKNIAIRIRELGSQRVSVKGDSMILVHQVLSNLLSNAIKFSERGADVVVTLDFRSSCPEISVRDYGLGIPIELQNKIFNAQERTSRSGTEGEAGTGFGLPLVKKFLEMLEGRIVVQSNSNPEFGQTGSEFTITFAPWQETEMVA